MIAYTYQSFFMISRICVVRESWIFLAAFAAVLGAGLGFFVCSPLAFLKIGFWWHFLRCMRIMQTYLIPSWYAKKGFRLRKKKKNQTKLDYLCSLRFSSLRLYLIRETKFQSWNKKLPCLMLQESNQRWPRASRKSRQHQMGAWSVALDSYRRPLQFS